MISDSPPYHEAYVWVWLPKQIEPIVAGRIVKENNLHYFTYSRHYRENPLAIPFSPFELPLKQGTFQPEGLNTLHSCLRDAAPDAWGRRVINYRHPAMVADELDYLLLSGSNRIGALDFQTSASQYQPTLLHIFLGLLTFTINMLFGKQLANFLQKAQDENGEEVSWVASLAAIWMQAYLLLLLP